MTNYEDQANEFLNEATAELTIFFGGFEVPPLWKNERHKHARYTFKIRTNKGEMTGVFYDSLAHTQQNKKPNNYDILSCVSAEYIDNETFEDFCDEFGYDTDSRTALEIYLECQKQSQNLRRIFTQKQLDKLLEIR